LSLVPFIRKLFFTPLFSGVKDDVICLDQTDHLLQAATHHAHEALVKLQDIKTHLVPPAIPTGNPTDSKVFTGQDDKNTPTSLLPRILEKMTQTERETELNHLKMARDHTIHTASTVVSGNTTPTADRVPPSSAGTPASMTISYTSSVANPSTTTSVLS
jgi:hypothetical protein